MYASPSLPRHAHPHFERGDELQQITIPDARFGDKETRGLGDWERWFPQSPSHQVPLSPPDMDVPENAVHGCAACQTIHSHASSA